MELLLFHRYVSLIMGGVVSLKLSTESNQIYLCYTAMIIIADSEILRI